MSRTERIQMTAYVKGCHHTVGGCPCGDMEIDVGIEYEEMDDGTYIVDSHGIYRVFTSFDSMERFLGSSEANETVEDYLTCNSYRLGDHV